MYLINQKQLSLFNAKYNIHYLSDDEVLKRYQRELFCKDKNFDVSKFINF